LIAVFAVGGATVLLKVVALVREIVVAHHFGTSDALDAFLVAAVIPDFVTNVVAGSLPAALIPIYVRAGVEEGPGAAKALLGAVLMRCVALLVLAAVVLSLAAPGPSSTPART
jgi:putative peptidoglycan lipid II flippase